MKAKFFQFTILIFIFSSCSNSKVITNQWIDYLNSTTKESLLASKTTHFLTKYDFEISNLLKETNKEDSVVIITKSGKIFKGLVTKSDFDGYFLKIQNNREIYIRNIEIKTINFIKQSSTLFVDTLNHNIMPSTAPVGNKNITNDTIYRRNKEISQYSKKQDFEIKDDVWDNTNSEFEPSTSLKQEIVKEQSISNKVQEPLSIISFISLVLSPFTAGIGLLLAFILSRISLTKIKQNPEKYKGKALARFTFILSTIIISLSLLLVLLVIAIFI